MAQNFVIQVFAVCSLMAGIVGQESGPQYSVAGVVVNSKTGETIKRAQVIVVHFGEARHVPVTLSTFTDSAGAFRFSAVPAGNYFLSAEKPGFYADRSDTSARANAQLTASVEDVRLKLNPLGVITGKVVDQAGQPIRGVSMMALSQQMVDGMRQTQPVRTVATDDRGMYRMWNFTPGKYFVKAAGKSGATFLYAGDMPPRYLSEEAFALTYFGGGETLDAAQAIQIEAGTEARANLNLTMKPAHEIRGALGNFVPRRTVKFELLVVTGATVTVKHDAPSELKGLIGLLTDGIGRDNGFQRQESFSGAQREFTFDAVPPGRYLVRISGSRGASDLLGRQVIGVNGLDVSVELPVRPTPTVSGTVQLKNPKAKLPGSLLASRAREDTGAVISTVVRPDGSFVFRSVTAAKWRPAIRGAEGYFASDVHVEGADFRDGVMDLLEGESVTLRLTASDETGRLQGFVMRGDAAVEGVLVVLAPASGAHDQVRYRGFQTDSDGSFDFKGVPAEDYLLFAVEDTEIEYANPAAVRRYLGNARRVHVEAHGVYSEKIPLTEVLEENKR